MSKTCAKCTKTVYPIELLNCLDKYWHKACFRCTTCNMTLNMKNYKGYNKEPYCNAHYPTTKFTAVADTPESKRLAANTKIQSNLQYHAEFERQKGSKVSVADDPETTRIKHNTEVQSNIAYWGLKDQRTEQEKKRPNEVADNVAIRRANPGKISDYDPAAEDYPPAPAAASYAQRSSANVVYDSQRGGEDPRRTSAHGGNKRASGNSYAPFSYGGSAQPPPPAATNQPTHDFQRQQQQQHQHQQQQQHSGYDQNRSSSNYGDSNHRSSQADPYAQQQGYGQQQQQPYSYGNPVGGGGGSRGSNYGGSQQQQQQQQQSPRTSGYNEDYRYNSSSGGGGRSSQGGYPGADQRYSGGHDPMHSHRVQPGSIADYDPMNDKHSSIVRNSGSGGSQPHQIQQPPRQEFQPPPPRQEPPRQEPPRAAPPPAQKQPRFRAMYDYTAADDDEVSFNDGDEISNVTIIDEGWMTGTVLRTGQHGMLPSNYVERM